MAEQKKQTWFDRIIDMVEDTIDTVLDLFSEELLDDLED